MLYTLKTSKNLPLINDYSSICFYERAVAIETIRTYRGNVLIKACDMALRFCDQSERSSVQSSSSVSITASYYQATSELTSCINLTCQSVWTCHLQPDARLFPVCCRFGRWPAPWRLFPLLIIFPLPIPTILMFKMALKSNLRDATSMFGPVIYQHTRTERRRVFSSPYERQLTITLIVCGFFFPLFSFNDWVLFVRAFAIPLTN